MCIFFRSCDTDICVNGKQVLNVLKSKHEWLVREEARLETMRKDENAKYEAMRDFFLEEKHILLI